MNDDLISVTVYFHDGDEVGIGCYGHECDGDGVFRCFHSDGRTLFWARADNIKYLTIDAYE